MSVFSDIQRPVVVRARTEVADGVVALDLAPTNGRPLPPWTPGSHVDLLLGDGLERQYSLCGDPADRTAYRVGRAARARRPRRVGGRARARGRRHPPAARPPQPLRVRAGRSDGVRRGRHRHHADALDDRGGRRRRGRLVGCTTPGGRGPTMAFVDELVAAHPRRVHVYAADEGRRLDVAAVTAGPTGQVLCCGPRRLLEAVESSVGRRVGACTPSGSRRASSGRRCGASRSRSSSRCPAPRSPCRPGRSILEVVEDSGAMVVSSCRVGTCGSCETPVLEGTVEHRDSVIGPGGSGTTMMICVSRAACDRLVLEL